MSGRRAGARFDAALGVTTEALLFLGELDPEGTGPSLEFATHYEPTPVADAEALLDLVSGEPATTTFIDAGCGMGRVVILAARRPFRQVVGFDLSPALVEIARENLAAGDPLRRCRDVRIVHADAAAYRFPPGDLAVYAYNPFRAPVFAAMLAALETHAGTVRVAYHTPLERDVFVARGWRAVAETPAGEVFAKPE